jgi:hypothetical protein
MESRFLGFFFRQVPFRLKLFSNGVQLDGKVLLLTLELCMMSSPVLEVQIKMKLELLAWFRSIVEMSLSMIPGYGEQIMMSMGQL